MTIEDKILMERARTIAGERASLTWHEGESPHRAIRILGCDASGAWEVGRDIEQALFGPRDPESGRYQLRSAGFTCTAGFAAVWVR